MNRPRRPVRPQYTPPKRRPGGPGGPGGGPGGQARRRSPLDVVPNAEEHGFKVLGGPVDRQILMAQADPLELVVIQGYARQIEDAYRASRLRPEDFWENHPELMEPARKMDEVLAGIQARRGGS